MASISEAETRTIGWIGCVRAIPNDDPDMLEMKAQYGQGKRSASMQESLDFDAWVKYCTAVSSDIILKMMNAVDPGETPPLADVIYGQIQEAQRQCMALYRPELTDSRALRAG